MQLGDQVGRLGAELGLQHLAQEGVVAVPLALAGRRGAPAGSGAGAARACRVDPPSPPTTASASGPLTLLQDRRTDQEPPLPSGTGGRGPRTVQVVAHQPVGAGERVVGRDVAVPDGQRGQVERRRPALGVPDQVRGRRLGQRRRRPRRAGATVSARDSARSSVPISRSRRSTRIRAVGSGTASREARTSCPARRHRRGERGHGRPELAAGQRLELVEHDRDGLADATPTSGDQTLDRAGGVVGRGRRTVHRLDQAQSGHDHRRTRRTGSSSDPVARDPRDPRPPTGRPLGQQRRLPVARRARRPRSPAPRPRASGRAARSAARGQRPPQPTPSDRGLVRPSSTACRDVRRTRRGAPVPPLHALDGTPGRSRPLVQERHASWHVVSGRDPGGAPAARSPAVMSSPAAGPHDARGVGMDRRWRVEQRLHDPPGLLDPVLAAEPRAVAQHRRVEQDLVRRRALAALVRRTPCRARSVRSARGRYAARRPGGGSRWTGRA